MSARIGEKDVLCITVVIRSHAYSNMFRRTSNVTGSICLPRTFRASFVLSEARPFSWVWLRVTSRAERDGSAASVARSGRTLPSISLVDVHLLEQC